MKLQERSYSTKVLRPKPQIHVEEDGSLIVIATSWGQHEHAQRASEEVIKYVNAAKADVEVTSPFEFLSCLTDEVNYVRAGVLIANELLYRGENRTEYFSGVEIMALYKSESQIAWAHVGCPSLYVHRKGRGLQPLSIGLDLSGEMQNEDDLLPPLPAQLLGLDPTCYVQCGHTLVREGDQLVLLASNNGALFGASEVYQQDLMGITQSMIQKSPESPFWLGLIDI